MDILLQILHILALFAVVGALIWAALGLQDAALEAAERLRNMLSTEGSADAAELLALERQVKELRSIINDVDERTEARWKRIDARERRAQRRDQREQEEAEEEEGELPAGFDPRQLGLPLGGAPNGQGQPQRMIPASHLFRR